MVRKVRGGKKTKKKDVNNNQTTLHWLLFKVSAQLSEPSCLLIPQKANKLKTNHLIRVIRQSSVSRGPGEGIQTSLTHVLCKRWSTWTKLRAPQGESTEKQQHSWAQEIRPKTEWEDRDTVQHLEDKKHQIYVRLSAYLEVRSAQQQQQFPLIVFQQSVLKLLCQLMVSIRKSNISNYCATSHHKINLLYFQL